jgi:hypothetical protein
MLEDALRQLDGWRIEVTIASSHPIV